MNKTKAPEDRLAAVNVYLNHAQIHMAEVFGDGNRSMGIRRALELMREQNDKAKKRQAK